MTNESPTPDPQHNVQRLLGRCMLRIQQYERLMKVILAEHELAGPVQILEAQRATRIEKLSDKSLGTLVKSLFETCVVPVGFERDLLPGDKTPTDRISMAFSVRLSVEPERWAQLKKGIEDLVAMRNDLVHHLIERFDVWTEDGCLAAIRCLEDQYECIDRHFGELAQWAEAMASAREATASFARTEAFKDLLANGIAPDGSFAWPHTGIVRVLREAAHADAVDGWARLDEASAWIVENHPKQTPEKYGCRTWPQVLSDSRQFDLQYRLQDNGRKVAWFRCRG